ncbi:hypothetical protein MHB42_19180 [Lysinibacillus sp. FSL K6-0232]
MLNFLTALMKSFLHLGGINMAIILCLVVGIGYLKKERKEQVKCE